MSKQRIFGIGVAAALAGLTAWQASGGNWVTAAIGALGTVAAFLPPVHKGES